MASFVGVFRGASRTVLGSAALRSSASRSSVRSCAVVQGRGIRWFSAETARSEEEAEAPASSSSSAEESQEQNEAAEAQAKMEELNEQVKEANEKMLRSMAEMENIRAIAKRDVESARTYAIQKFAKSLLDVADNLGRALESVEVAENESETPLGQLHYGVELTHTELVKVFASHDITKFGDVGEDFDPNLHEAMFQAEDPSKPANTISSIIKHGYMFKDRVIRPAQVGTVKGE